MKIQKEIISWPQTDSSTLVSTSLPRPILELAAMLATFDCFCCWFPLLHLLTTADLPCLPWWFSSFLWRCFWQLNGSWEFLRQWLLFCSEAFGVVFEPKFLLDNELILNPRRLQLHRPHPSIAQRRWHLRWIKRTRNSVRMRHFKITCNDLGVTLGTRDMLFQCVLFAMKAFGLALTPFLSDLESQLIV